MLKVAVATRNLTLAYAISLRDSKLIGEIPNPDADTVKLIFASLDGWIAFAEVVVQTALRLRNVENASRPVAGGLMLTMARRIEAGHKATLALQGSAT